MIQQNFHASTFKREMTETRKPCIVPSHIFDTSMAMFHEANTKRLIAVIE